MNSYTFHISLYDLAFLGAIFIGLAFAMQLWFTKTINRSANRFLALALVTMILWMARVLAIDIRLETYLPHWDWLPMQFLLALGPLMYFYVLKITRPQYKLRWRDLVHFSPLLLEQSALALQIRESAKTGAATYATHTFHQLNPVLQLLIFISIIIYLYRSYQLIQDFYKRQQPVLMDRSLLEFRWLRRLLAATALLWLLWIFCAAFDYFGYRSQSSIQVYYPFYIFFVVIIIWTAMAAFLKPQAAVTAQAATPLKQPVPAELRAKGVWLKRAMEANLYYQDPELSLSSLAEKLRMQPHELSRVINTALKKGFNDFINEYRVRDVVAKMKDPSYSNMTLLGIAYEAGFNSKATFNRSFKQVAGKSAAEFKNDLEKQDSSYDLTRLSGPAAVISNHRALPWAEVKLNRNFMFRNYLKTAFRGLSKNKTFAILNIAGLSIGVACSLLIALYVLDELSYDRFNARANDIYRIDEQLKYGDFNYNGAEVPAIMGPVFAKDFMQIEHYTRLKANSGVIVKRGNENIREDQAAYADSSLFDVFTLHMIAGDRKAALKEPHSLVVTASTAKKYFGSVDIIGKALLLNGNTNYKITGVIEDIPAQSHFNFGLFMPISELDESRNDSWINYNFQTYLLLKPGTDFQAFEKELNETMQRYQSQQFKSILNISEDDFKKAGNYIKCSLMPLMDIHLHSNLAYEFEVNGSIQYVYIFSAIAIFILLLACINFMNLSTARSANRAKEVGVRKVLGGLKNNLITQFLAESLVACFLSFVIAIVMVAFLLPYFNQLAGKQIQVSMLFSPGIVGGILLLLVFVSLISGSYPAFFLSSFQPIKVLKGSLSTGFKGSALRNTLVVVQFTISVILMIGTLVIYNQLLYIRNKDLGFTKEEVLMLQNTAALNGHTKAFEDELLGMPGVKNVTSSGFLPVSGNRTDNGFVTTPHFDGKNFTLMQSWRVDDRYLPTFQIQLKSGRNFSAQYLTDSNAVIINETAAKLFGKVDPVNKKLYQIADLSAGRLIEYDIIGVIKDFNFNSLHEQVAPLVLNLQQDNQGMAVRFSSSDIPGLLSEIKATWKTMAPTQPFSYSFMDEEFSKLYSVDQRREKIFFLFSILAIVIACLGLFGLVTFAAEQRIKEIGIRKVLGAATKDIFIMLSKDFARLILVSICIASPIAWWAMSKWLQDFAYRINIGWWMFAAVGAICLLIALVTISFQAIKAALANPVKSLRSE